MVLLRPILSPQTLLGLSAGLAVMHAGLAHDAVPGSAHLAGEDVAILFGREEAAPATSRRGARSKLLVALTAVLGSLVEPPR